MARLTDWKNCFDFLKPSTGDRALFRNDARLPIRPWQAFHGANRL
jgi:hypothetical protein